MFFTFFKIFIFWVNKGVKRQKMTQHDEKFCLSNTISKEPYIIWSSFTVHLCKRVVYPAFFSFFQNFDFPGCWKGKKGKKISPKWQKILFVTLVSQEPYIMWLSFMVHMCKMLISWDVFFIFEKFFWVARRWGGGGKRAKNGPGWKKILSVSLIFWFLGLLGV